MSQGQQVAGRRLLSLDPLPGLVPSCMSIRSVVPSCDQHDGGKHQDQDADDQSQHLQPAWYAGRCCAVSVNAGGARRLRQAVGLRHLVLLGVPDQHIIYETSCRCADCLNGGDLYHGVVPRLWNETIEAHRKAVREAILETTWSLVTEHGLRSVTMSQIAEKTGIGRATLYKYFPHVEAILYAWHRRHVEAHLAALAAIRDRESALANGSRRCCRRMPASATTASATAAKSSGN